MSVIVPQRPSGTLVPMRVAITGAVAVTVTALLLGLDGSAAVQARPASRRQHRR